MSKVVVINFLMHVILIFCFRAGNYEGDLSVEDLPSANLENIGQLTLPCRDYIKVK